MTAVIEDIKKANWFKRHKIWTAVIAVFVLFAIIGAGGDDSKNASTTKADTAAKTADTAAAPTAKAEATATPAPTPTPAAKATTPAPTAKPAPAPTPAAPTTTVSQRNAVSKARSYLAYSGFSHDGLVAQLEYEQFSNADAVYGADNSGGGWNAQAAKKAKSYMEYSSFSRQGLIDQLVYDKFTNAQATHGADSVGL